MDNTDTGVRYKKSQSGSKWRGGNIHSKQLDHLKTSMQDDFWRILKFGLVMARDDAIETNVKER